KSKAAVVRSGRFARSRDTPTVPRTSRTFSVSWTAHVDTETGQEDGTSDGKYYQLTHDYLVPSLREWLSREQPEALAELLLYAGEKQFSVVYPKLKQHGHRALSLLE